MLGFVLLYFIGKSFYTLAGDYGKHQWGFAILGIASYYAGAIIGGIIIGAIILYSNPYSEISDLVYGLIGMPFGLLTWWGLHSYFKKSWSNKRKVKNHDVLDEGLLD